MKKERRIKTKSKRKKLFSWNSR